MSPTRAAAQLTWVALIANVLEASFLVVVVMSFIHFGVVRPKDIVATADVDRDANVEHVHDCDWLRCDRAWERLCHET